MLLNIVIAFWALVPVDASPQFGFFSSLASEVLGVGQSVFSDISPNTQSPQDLPTPSSNLPVLSTAIPSPSPTLQTQPQPQPSATTPSPSSTPQIKSISASPPSISQFVSTSSASLALTSQTSPSSVISFTSSITSSFHSISSLNVPNTSQTITSQTSTVSTLSAAISQRIGSPTSHGNAPGIVAGIILGVVGLFAILGLFGILIRHRNKRLREGLEQHKLDTHSWNWKTLEDDGNPSARYDQPGSSNTVVQKPLPAFVAQRKYLPYRPQQYQESPISSNQAIGASLLMSSSSEMSEMDGQPIGTMPVELEGSIPSVKAQESVEDDTVKSTAMAKYAGALKLVDSKELDSGTNQPHSSDPCQTQVVSGPLVVRNN